MGFSLNVLLFTLCKGIGSQQRTKITKQNELVDLFVLGGFPEPFFGGEEVEAKRWSREYRSRIIEEELTSLEKVKAYNLEEIT